MDILSNLQPANVFRFFEQLCAIPHGSGDTKRISDFCAEIARSHHLRYRQDEANNIIIWKSGTPGYESAPTVLLQGHLDMVCAKEPDCDLQFDRDGLRLRVENGMISADGTTLGGDDGIAVALSLALLTAADIPHPPLEAVFTVDEEIGMLGAAALDCSDLNGRIMLNMDSEEEGKLLVSCAGGVTAVCHLPIELEQTTALACTLTLSGLTGGHSGGEIHHGRANANQLAGRLLWQLTEQQVSFRLCSLTGGEKDNAIANSVQIKLCVPEEQGDLLLAVTEKFVQTVQSEYASTDPSLTMDTAFAQEQTVAVLTQPTQTAVIAALVNLPGGVQRMSHAIPGLVQTSLNLGILRTEEQEVTMSFSVRSSVSSEKEALVAKLRCLMAALGGTVTCSGDYPAWEYSEHSPLRELMVNIYEKMFGQKPEVYALHAGVECGLFASQLPGLDCVSFGPDMEDIHTPREKLSVESVERTWRFTCEILKHLK